MPNQEYQIAGSFPAYDTEPGGTVTLDPSDPLVQMNIANGVLAPAKDAPAPGRMTCPACETEGLKRPAKLAGQEELDTHYHERHPGLVSPDWKEES